MANDQKLKVGLVFDDSLDSNDGVAQYVKTLGGWLGAQGHEVRYLVGETKLSSWESGRIYSLAKNLKVFFNGNKLSMPWLSHKREIRKVLDSEGFDILHVMVPYSPFMAQRVINLAARNTAVVGTFHIFPSGSLSRVGSRFLQVAYGRSLKRFDAVASVSLPAAGFAKSGYNLTTSVIPNPVDLSKFARASTASNSGHKIVFLGRLVKRKGCQQLIEAFSVLSKELPDATLAIAGAGPLRPRLEKLSRSLGLDKKIRFTGYINENAKAALLASADVACFPSLYGESFGIVLVEAMAAGAGVVLAGNNPGYSSVLGEQPLLLINPLDKHAFAKRIEQLLTDQNLRTKVHRWQDSQVRQYDIEIVGNQILDVYRSAIAKRNKKRHN